MSYETNRRTLLKKTTASSVALLASSTGSVHGLESPGTIDLIECGIEHEVPSVPDNTRRPVLDSPPTYYHLNDKLVVTERLPDEERRRLQTRDTVVSFDGIHSVPTASLQRDRNHHLSTELRADFEPSRAVLLNEPYAPPSFGLQATSNEVTVTTLNGQQSLGPGTEATFELPSRSVSVVSYHKTNPRIVERPLEGSEKVYDYEKQTTEVTVKPRLHIQYHSEKTVFKATERTEEQ